MPYVVANGFEAVAGSRILPQPEGSNIVSGLGDPLCLPSGAQLRRQPPK